ncbi:MAG: phosphoribosylglycinamide formyltransferase [Bacteroidales bacterium]|nr:phosphoribosylglycinamide formyltransferase [Bacteroidales bacterium]
MHNIAIFASGNGTNCENIIRYFQPSADIRVALVISNKPDAYVLTRAFRLHVPTVVASKTDINNPAWLLPQLRKYDIDFIVLAGFLLMIPPFLVEAFENRIINIHPSLVPKYCGKGMYGHRVHEAVKAAGETETGITIHYVNNVCDGGAIIRQFTTPILASDTVEDIESKIHVLEQAHFPQVIEVVILKTK